MGYRLAPIAPLRSSFMVTALLGFLISAFYIFDMKDATGKVYSWAPSLGFTFSLIFILMFIASIISMTYAQVDNELERGKKRRKN